ncbi:hypothetical protein KY317_01320 [Candidatus Woesearchaeota archaeon]|nr:hypothetical protein [Candidatus Woesearchaeota archaeon]
MIENIQKVNKLAQELMQQGIAVCREDAVKKAQQFLNKEIINEQEITSANRVQAGDITIEKLKDRFDRHKDIIQRQITDMRSAINALADKIDNVKQSFVTRREAVTIKQAGFEPEQKTKELKTGESHPKKGNWKSQDVAIENIFYCGNK